MLCRFCCRNQKRKEANKNFLFPRGGDMKTNQIVLPLILLIATIISSCNRDEVNMKKEEENLLNADKEFAAYSKAHGAAEAFKEFLTDDALQFSAQRDVVVGNLAVYDIMKEGDDGYDLLWEPQFAEVAKSGDIGWTWGYYDLHFKENGETRYGKYLNVWKKNAAGKWKVAADIGNPGPDKESRNSY